MDKFTDKFRIRQVSVCNACKCFTCSKCSQSLNLIADIDAICDESYYDTMSKLIRRHRRLCFKLTELNKDIPQIEYCKKCSI